MGGHESTHYEKCHSSHIPDWEWREAGSVHYEKPKPVHKREVGFCISELNSGLVCKGSEPTFFNLTVDKLLNTVVEK